MRKILGIGLVALMLVAGTGCSKTNDDKAAVSNVDKSATAQVEEVKTWAPDRDITIRVPFSAGGSADTFARIYGQSLQKSYDTSVIVTNIKGANGAVAAADMDAYDPSPSEMMVSGISLFTSTPLFNPEINVDLNKYEIITSLVAEEFVLCTAPGNTGITDWDSFNEYANANRMLCASNPPGGTTHMLASKLFGEAGLNNIEKIPTQGGNKSLIALLSGDVDCAIVPESQALQYIEEGQVEPILAFSKETYTGFPGYEVPSAKSLGHDIVFKSCNFILVRKGVDQNVIDQIYNAYIEYQNTDDFKSMASEANYKPANEDGETVRDNINNSAALFKDIYETYYK
jgi:tripartite-type tricarboxylate transporter receptor subunit TctC